MRTSGVNRAKANDVLRRGSSLCHHSLKALAPQPLEVCSATAEQTIQAQASTNSPANRHCTALFQHPLTRNGFFFLFLASS